MSLVSKHTAPITPPPRNKVEQPKGKRKSSPEPTEAIDANDKRLHQHLPRKKERLASNLTIARGVRFMNPIWEPSEYKFYTSIIRAPLPNLTWGKGLGNSADEHGSRRVELSHTLQIEFHDTEELLQFDTERSPEFVDRDPHSKRTVERQVAGPVLWSLLCLRTRRKDFERFETQRTKIVNTLRLKSTGFNIREVVVRYFDFSPELALQAGEDGIITLATQTWDYPFGSDSTKRPLRLEMTFLVSHRDFGEQTTEAYQDAVLARLEQFEAKFPWESIVYLEIEE